MGIDDMAPLTRSISRKSAIARYARTARDADLLGDAIGKSGAVSFHLKLPKEDCVYGRRGDAARSVAFEFAGRRVWFKGYSERDRSALPDETVFRGRDIFLQLSDGGRTGPQKRRPKMDVRLCPQCGLQLPATGSCECTTQSRVDHPTRAACDAAAGTRAVSDAPLLDLVPARLRHLSGSVTYSGVDAFSRPSPIYLLGLNPGGDPDVIRTTVAEQLARVLEEEPANWSAYRDERWGTHAQGRAPMQRRIQHLCRAVDIDPGQLPASNLVFVRSRREASVTPMQMRTWAEQCWPFHERVIERLGARVIVCLGSTVADFVRTMVGASTQTDQFVEANGRGWTSRTFQARSGLRIVGMTHPSVADWCTPATDPTSLVVRAVHA